MDDAAVTPDLQSAESPVRTQPQEVRYAGKGVRLTFLSTSWVSVTTLDLLRLPNPGQNVVLAG
jgi:hypothetical protein